MSTERRAMSKRNLSASPHPPGRGQGKRIWESRSSSIDHMAPFLSTYTERPSPT